MGTCSDALGLLRVLAEAKLCSRKTGLATIAGVSIVTFEFDVEGTGLSVAGFGVGALKVLTGWPPSVNTINRAAIRSKNSRFAQVYA